MHFFKFDFEKLDFKVQTSFSLFPLSKFHFTLSLSFHSSFPTFKLLSLTSYGGELVLDSFFLKWRLQLSFLFFHSAVIDLQEAKGFIDEEDPRSTNFTWSYTLLEKSYFMSIKRHFLLQLLTIIVGNITESENFLR